MCKGEGVKKCHVYLNGHKIMNMLTHNVATTKQDKQIETNSCDSL